MILLRTSYNSSHSSPYVLVQRLHYSIPVALQSNTDTWVFAVAVAQMQIAYTGIFAHHFMWAKQYQGNNFLTGSRVHGWVRSLVSNRKLGRFSRRREGAAKICLLGWS